MDRITTACIALSLVMLASNGCTQPGSPRSPGVKVEPATLSCPEAAQKNRGPIVGHLKSRDKLITIRRGIGGPLYTVMSKDGTILAEDLPAQELYANFPRLKNTIEGSTANWAGL